MAQTLDFSAMQFTQEESQVTGVKVIGASEDIDSRNSNNVEESDKVVWTNKNDKLEVELISEFPD